VKWLSASGVKLCAVSSYLALSDNKSPSAELISSSGSTSSSSSRRPLITLAVERVPPSESMQLIVLSV